MNQQPDILYKPSIGTIPEYCSSLTLMLQKGDIHYNPRDAEIHNHRILLCRFDDSQIIQILSKNSNVLTLNAKQQYPNAITSFIKYVQNRSGSKTPCYGIKSHANNQNYLTRRICFKIIDRLQEGWVKSNADEYYTHPHKEYPENTHQNSINEWLFFSKGTNKLRPNFLVDEAELIRFLALRFGMSDKITCRTTMTNDLKRIAGIHIWVLKSALEEFNYVFNFNYEQDSKITYRSILNV
jgi:hypothetical protein